MDALSVSAAGQKIHCVRANTAYARHVDSVPARKWRPTFFSRSDAKKFARRKSSQIYLLCLETPAPGTEKWRFWPSKKRHFSPFFSCPFRAPAGRACISKAPNAEAGEVGRETAVLEHSRLSRWKSTGASPRWGPGGPTPPPRILGPKAKGNAPRIWKNQGPSESKKRPI